MMMSLSMKGLLVLFLAGAIRAQQLPTVTLDTGVWQGVPTQLPSSSKVVYKFLGLPFGAPPVCFAPPRPPTASKETRVASKLPPACLQNGGSGFGMVSEESEDCLYLNIFAPAFSGTNSTAGRAVLVWFFGGALQFGSASLPGYDGTAFASNQDVILVATNYRTNLFGFPGIVPGEQAKDRNLGFLDQRLALRWVQDNIAKFGGDPSKVTIFGQSAGARSVNFHLLTNNPTNPPFRAVIVMSGSAHIATGVTPRGPPPAEPPFVTLAKGVGCQDGPGLLECMRKLPAAKLQQAVRSSRTQFGAVGDDDFTTLKDPENARREHKVANVPLLIGTTADEQRSGGLAVMSTKLQQFLDANYKEQGLNAALAKAYAVGPTSHYKSDFEAITALQTDVAFTCVTSRESKVSAEAGYPTWRYLYNASFPNSESFPGSGAWHSSELQYVFGNFKTPKGPSKPEEISLSAAMQGAWATFAKDPLGGPGWNKVGTIGGKELGHFNYNGKLIVESPTFLDRHCALFKEILDAKNAQNALD